MIISFARLCLCAGPVGLSIALLSPGSARADALDNWTTTQVATNPAGFMGSLFGGVTHGNGRYVAVGMYVSSDAGLVQTSEDGLNWTNRTGYSFSVLDLYDVTFAKGVFVAVGYDWYFGENLHHSTNGIDWTAHTSGIGNVNRVTFGNNLFVAVGDGLITNSLSSTNRSIFTSPDGIAWTRRFSGAPINDVHSLTDIAFGAGRFVAVDNAKHIHTSDAGTIWTRTTNSSASDRVSFCGGLFIIPSAAGTNLVSTDGLNWSLLTNNTGSVFGRVLYTNGIYLALSDTNLFSSTDGTNWIRRGLQPPANVLLKALAFGPGNVVVVGQTRYSNPTAPVAYLSDPLAAVKISSGLPPQLNVSGVTGRSYRVEFVTDIRASNWQALATFPLNTSPQALTDAQATNSSRYYRSLLLSVP